MTVIDYELLYNSLRDSIHESEHSKYDFETLVSSATPCWDDTAVKIRSSDFLMIFDLINYELVDHTQF